MRQIGCNQIPVEEEIVRLLIDNNNQIELIIFTDQNGVAQALRRPIVNYFDYGLHAFGICTSSPQVIRWQEITEVHLI